VAPIDYSPILLLRPFGFRIAPNTLPSGKPQEDGFRSVLAVSGFRLCARLDFSIPSFFSQPARHYPRLRIQRPSSERRGDFNPHDSCAAQRTLRPHPTSHPRTCSACGVCLPEPARHKSGHGRDLPGSAQRTSPRAQGLRLREVLPMQAIRHGTMLPSLQRNEIGTSELDPFRTSILGPWSPL